MAPIFFEIVGFSAVLMFRGKIFGLLVFVKIEVSNFIGKSLNLAPLFCRCHDTSEYLGNLQKMTKSYIPLNPSYPCVLQVSLTS